MSSIMLRTVAMLGLGMEGDGHGSRAAGHRSVLEAVEKIMHRFT